MSQLQGVISEWGSSYTVVRTTKGTLTKGVYATGSPANVSIVANVQPLEGDNVKNVPEGRRVESVRLLFTTTALKVADATYESDQVTLDGTVWEVIKVEHWVAWGTGHYRCHIARRDVG